MEEVKDKNLSSNKWDFFDRFDNFDVEEFSQKLSSSNFGVI